MFSHRGGEDQELTREHSEGRHAKDRERPQHQAPADRGADPISPRMSSMSCVPAFCDACPAAKKIDDFVSE